MTKQKATKSRDKDHKSSQIIIISKSRLSSPKDKVNFKSLQDGDKKITIQMNNESINKKKKSSLIKILKKINLNLRKIFICFRFLMDT